MDTEILTHFAIDGSPVSIAPFGGGHINHTFLITTDKKKRYICQAMNTSIFKNTDALMENVFAVTEYLQKNGIETINFVRTNDGKQFYRAPDGRCYRVYNYIDNAVAYDSGISAETLRIAGHAFGEFQNQLADFDASVLTETIPQFHDTPKRFRDFEAALAADVKNRAATCRPEIEFFLSHRDCFSKIADALKNGLLPLRVTHNDTKLNNILFDEVTGKARAVIDLDTVMPGSLLYDFGDSIRFGASTAAEDEKNLDLVHFSPELFRAYSEGFCSAVAESLTDLEIELLPYSAFLMTAECGMRFLGDYLSGDTYFATHYDDHNLVRARTQIRLASEMEAAFPEMEKIIREIVGR